MKATVASEIGQEMLQPGRELLALADVLALVEKLLKLPHRRGAHLGSHAERLAQLAGPSSPCVHRLVVLDLCLRLRRARLQRQEAQSL
eukprot:8361272-Pyramimonas_sp.AAC.1